MEWRCIPFFQKQTIGLLFLAMAAFSCHSPVPEVTELPGPWGLGHFEQFVLVDSPVSVYPGRHWVVTEDGQWKFQGAARLMVWLPEPATEPLRLTLASKEPTDRFHFKFLWDGEEIDDGHTLLKENGGAIEIPAALLTEGVHDFHIERVMKWGQAPDRKIVANIFNDIAFQMGDFTEFVHQQDLDRLRYICSLLEFGVTGLSDRKRSGCIFDGPRALVTEVVIEDSGQLEFPVENASSETAEFFLKVGSEERELTVGPGEIAIFEMNVAAGAQSLRLEVSGAADGAYLWASPIVKQASPMQRAPIILITLDTTRKDSLTPYGGLAEASPVLDGFARTSTLFENAYASSPWTLPSHASMMTGRYPTLHGAGVTSDVISPRSPKLATLLRKAGYVTAGFAGGEMCKSRWGVARGFQTYDDPEGFESSGDDLTDRVIDSIESIGENPFYVFVNYFDPHAVYQAPPQFEELFDVAGKQALLENDKGWRDFAAGVGPHWGEVVKGNLVATPEALAYLKVAYLAEIAFMDAQIGRLFETLKERDLFDEAFIVVVADHGEFLGEHGLFSHGARLDPELVEVPLLIKWPGQREPVRRAELVSHVDLFATILEVAGVDIPQHDGLVITGQASEELETRSIVYIEEHESRLHPLIDRMRIAHHLFGLQEIQHREVVWNGGMTCADLNTGEWIASTCASTWQERLGEIGRVAKALRQGVEESLPGALSEDERRSLEALGYLN